MRLLPLPLLLLLAAPFPAPARAAFDCKLALGDSAYDLTPLAGVHHFETTTPTPPTITKIAYDLSLCSPLPIPSPSPDTCPAGTHICQTTLTTRAGLEDRIVSVVPVAGDIGSGALSPSATASSGGDGTAWVLGLEGGSYNDVTQSARIEMVCDPAAKETVPSLVSYDPKEGVLSLRWTTFAACATSGGTPPPKGGDGDPDPTLPPPPHDGGGGWGFFSWLFTLVVGGAVLYFVVGAYYNYSQYGSTGWDMLPHRDVWRDLPYVIQDLFKGRGGANRSGYSALG